MATYTELQAKIRRLENQLAEERLRRAQAEALAEIHKQHAEAPERKRLNAHYYYCCPDCGREIEYPFEENYCSNCGQKFDWDAPTGYEPEFSYDREFATTMPMVDIYNHIHGKSRGVF